MLLRPAVLSSDIFSYRGSTKTFVAEISDFGPGFNFGRVYDDACDEGLTMVSARTGHTVVFAMDHVDKDDEGDVRFWQLVPAQYQRGAPDCKVIIFND